MYRALSNPERSHAQSELSSKINMYVLFVAAPGERTMRPLIGWSYREGSGCISD